MSAGRHLFGDRRAPDGSLVADNFDRWFTGSQVVDHDSGLPQLLFHGTVADIPFFDLERCGQNDHGWYGAGIYLTADPATASAYANYENLLEGGKLRDTPPGANVLPVYAVLRNPYRWPKGRAAAITVAERDELTAQLRAAGHDGVIVPNEYQNPQYAARQEVVAFRPEQIKSAIGNSGLFDPRCVDLADRHVWEREDHTQRYRERMRA